MQPVQRTHLFAPPVEIHARSQPTGEVDEWGYEIWAPVEGEAKDHDNYEYIEMDASPDGSLHRRKSECTCTVEKKFCKSMQLYNYH